MDSPRLEFSLDTLIAVLEARPGEPHRCPYLADREARVCGFVAETFDAELYHRLMDRGFRRSGKFFYRPACEGCRAPVSRLASRAPRGGSLSSHVWDTPLPRSPEDPDLLHPPTP